MVVEVMAVVAMAAAVVAYVYTPTKTIKSHRFIPDNIFFSLVPQKYLNPLELK